MTALSRRAELTALAAIVVLCATALVVFSVFDRRGLVDHDYAFAGEQSRYVHHARSRPLAERPAILLEAYTDPPALHPNLAGASIAAFTTAFGWTRANVRLANLPWLLLLVVGTWALGRELGSARMALLAAFLVGTAPVTIHMSRKSFFHFHAAALTPLALALLIRVARGPAPAWVWGLLTVFVAARLGSHPIQFPDLLLAFALAAVVGMRRRAVTEGRPARFLGALVLVGLAGLWFGSPWIVTGPDEGLRGYLAHAGGYTTAEPFRSGVLDGLAVSLGRVGHDLVHWSLLPPLLALVVVPGLLAAPGAVRRAPLLAVPALLVLVEIPVFVLTVGNGAFAPDWLHLLPPLFVLCLASLDRLPVPRTPRRVWTGLVVAWSAFVLVFPLAVSWGGPDPILAPEAYRAAPARWFLTSTHGGPQNTAHLLARGEHAPAALARWAMERSDDDPITLGLHDLTWDYTAWPGAECPTPSGDGPAWSWARRPTRHWPFPHPFTLRGRHARWVDDPTGPDGPRLHLVPLWFTPKRVGEEWCPPEPEHRDALLFAASEAARLRFGPDAEVLVLDDPTGWIVGTADHARHPNEYSWDAALLVDLGAGHLR